MDVTIHSSLHHFYSQNQPAELSVAAPQLMFCSCGGVTAFAVNYKDMRILTSKLDELHISL